MANSINNPKKTQLNTDEIREAIRQFAISKNPELVDEEFEIEFWYDAYDQRMGAEIKSL